MAADMPEPPVDFESWLFCRISQAVEAGEVPADLLTELQEEIEAAKTVPEDEGRARAVETTARLLEISPEDAAQALAALEAPPRAIREWQMRRIAETWLEAQRKAYSPHGYA